ncbi:hypothetical protein LTR72_010912 [Exophiala xenobiotica]|nr:hypothetical protein LTR72_010912 [Exophiala xenobiotica]KAK5244119.1 hypothetical protein LTS06_010241 [Exophiala xenobiotica]KAK5260993.1 hypothetical protein LTR40_003059 [Exophiala xenobiotica]KAK5285511.1 hypothetical protein LTR14_010907 [Exophiala xenobiotica]KAK5367114.1 hypothetical protein LTS13_007967 [Exophiala xenobiotica]
MPFNPTYATVENEECTLKYWHQGKGPLLVFIAGGGGIGRQFNRIFEYLDQDYTVCTYDRRQTNESVVHGGHKPLNPAQQCRDIIAIVKALGRQRTSILGNSGGGVLALQFAVSYPEHLEHVIVHEAPTTILLDDATYHLNRAFMLLDTYAKGGVQAASDSFRTEMKGYGPGDEALSRPGEADGRNFWENEFLTFTIYCPDLTKIVPNGVSIAVAAGRKSDDAFYARTTFRQSEIMECPRYMVPGHHNGYESQPLEFAHELKDILDKMNSSKKRCSVHQTQTEVVLVLGAGPGHA